MTETLNPPRLDTDPTPEENWDDVADALRGLNGETSADEVGEISPKSIDQRVVSSRGASIMAAAGRINSLLERRIVNKAHKEALADYRDNDRDSYREHMNELAVDDDVSTLTHVEAYSKATYENTRQAGIAAREATVEFGEAAIDTAKSKVRGFGRAALRGLKTAGFIGVGLAVAGSNKAEKLAGKAGQKMEGAIESSIDAASETVASAKEAREYRREAAKVRKEQALNQKYERHAKRMERRRALGNFVLRTRATGEAAVDTWKNYPEK